MITTSKIKAQAVSSCLAIIIIIVIIKILLLIIIIKILIVDPLYKGNICF